MTWLDALIFASKAARDERRERQERPDLFLAVLQGRRANASSRLRRWLLDRRIRNWQARADAYEHKRAAARFRRVK